MPETLPLLPLIPARVGEFAAETGALSRFQQTATNGPARKLE